MESRLRTEGNWIPAGGRFSVLVMPGVWLGQSESTLGWLPLSSTTQRWHGEKVLVNNGMACEKKETARTSTALKKCVFRNHNWQEKSVECLKGTKHVLKSWDKHKWEHWGLQGKMSRKWQEKNAEGWGATIQIPDNCVPKTEQSRNSGIPQEISASVRRSLPSLQSLCSFRSYVIPDPRRPPSIPKTAGSNFTERTLSASTGCREGIAPLSAAVHLMPGTTWAGDSPPRCCVGVLEVFGLLSPGSISLPFIVKKKNKQKKNGLDTQHITVSK